MNTFQLHCFLTVAETLSFARAAERLHVTQPAVTQQIHSLEKELNVSLFRRTTRTVRLTAEGMAFLADAQHMIALAERAKKRFEHPPEEEIQPLALGCSSYTQLPLWLPALRRLRQEYPTLHPRMQVASFLHLRRLLEEEELDAVIGFAEWESRRNGILYHELARIPVDCICPAEHPLAGREAVPMEALREERLVVLNPARIQSEVARLSGQLLEGRTPDELYFCESVEAVAALVSAGFGIALLPGLVLPGDWPLGRVPLAGVAPVSYGVYARPEQGGTLLRRLLQLLRELPLPVEG